MIAKIFTTIFIVLISPALAIAQSWHAQITPEWSTVERTLQATPTYQIVGKPLLRPAFPVHVRVYENVHNLQANYARFQLWYPYPPIAVAELEAPSNDKTHWDFSVLDPVVVDFVEATKGHPVVMNLAPVPQWMYKTEKPVLVPPDPNQINYDYAQGTELRDPSMKEVAGYFKRLASWYLKGGFRDEYGVWHESGHHYKFAYWEVLNEVDGYHHMTPEAYTKLYDAIVGAVREVDPSMKFIGLALAGTRNPHYFEYFLNPENHEPGIPIDGISYHFYAHWSPDTDSDSVFEQGDKFLNTVRYIDAIRERLSPTTRSFINEVGFISEDDRKQADPEHVSAPLPDRYWNLAASFYAYMFNKLSQLPSIQTVGMSSMLAYPNHSFQSITMTDWRTGQPNARYWTLKLLIDHLALNSKVVHTSVVIDHVDYKTIQPHVQAQAFVTPDGRREILVINQRDQPYEVAISGANGGEVKYVDQATGFRPAATQPLVSEWVGPSAMIKHSPSQVLLKDRFLILGFGVSVVTLAR